MRRGGPTPRPSPPEGISMKKATILVKAFFSNPWIRAAEALLMILAILLSIYLYRAGSSNRDLTYYPHPVRAIIFKSDQSPRIEVFFEGQRITKDIITVQAALWNNGKLPVKHENILEGIELYTAPSCPIIDAIIRKQSRDVTGVSIDKTKFAEGRIPLDWKILEKGDGGIIQITFVGSPDTDVLIKGTIEGQKIISVPKPSFKVKSAQEQIRELKTMRNIAYGICIFTVGVSFVFLLVPPFSPLRRRRTVWILFGFSVIYSLILIILVGQLGLPLAPPFGFE